MRNHISDKLQGRIPSIDRILRYLFFGGSAFALDAGLLWMFVEWISCPVWLSTIVAFIISTAYAFFTQMKYTFSCPSFSSTALIRYLILLFFNMIFSTVFVTAFDYFTGHYLIAKCIGMGLIVCWNYPIMRQWVYRP